MPARANAAWISSRLHAQLRGLDRQIGDARRKPARNGQHRSRRAPRRSSAGRGSVASIIAVRNDAQRASPTTWCISSSTTVARMPPRCSRTQLAPPLRRRPARAAADAGPNERAIAGFAALNAAAKPRSSSPSVACSGPAVKRTCGCGAQREVVADQRALAQAFVRDDERHRANGARRPGARRGARAKTSASPPRRPAGASRAAGPGTVHVRLHARAAPRHAVSRGPRWWRTGLEGAQPFGLPNVEPAAPATALKPGCWRRAWPRRPSPRRSRPPPRRARRRTVRRRWCRRARPSRLRPSCTPRRRGCSRRSPTRRTPSGPSVQPVPFCHAGTGEHDAAAGARRGPRASRTSRAAVDASCVSVVPPTAVTYGEEAGNCTCPAMSPALAVIAMPGWLNAACASGSMFGALPPPSSDAPAVADRRGIVRRREVHARRRGCRDPGRRFRPAAACTSGTPPTPSRGRARSRRTTSRCRCRC